MRIFEGQNEVEKGDLYIEFKIIFPKKVDGE